ncbi:MAG: carboxymuconolactone decarboxylase family protein [Solirubrobacteraceae bacterium]|nr:carboxymuconolactone decarboxylase family protein [Solirubrobacteraceae bacterium]
MARIDPIDPSRASGKARELLDELAQRGGTLGPMVLAMANAPALLRGYIDLNRAMKRSHLDRRISERIALAAQEWIGCDVCLAAHAHAARELGLSDTDIELARQGTATDAKTAALVAFGQQVIAAPSEVSDEQIDELRAFGYRDEQIAEVVGLVSLQLLTGAFNLVAGIHTTPTARSAA